MNKSSSYKIKAKIEDIENGINPILTLLEDLQIDHKICFKIRLALDELLTNVVSYAYDEPEDGDIEISYQLSDNPSCIYIDICDYGRAFNPLEIADPKIDAAAEDRRIGGLGLFLVKNTMDSISYRREGDKNIMSLKKII